MYVLTHSILKPFSLPQIEAQVLVCVYMLLLNVSLAALTLAHLGWAVTNRWTGQLDWTTRLFEIVPRTRSQTKFNNIGVR